MQESPTIPHSLAQVLWLLLASSLGWGGAEVRSWLARRKREPVELAKISAETRQIHVSSDVSLMQTASEVLTNAWRMRDERDHWERQAAHWEKKAAELEQQVELNDTQAKMDNRQIKQLKAAIDMLTSILDEKRIPYPHWDYVNRTMPDENGEAN